MFFHSSIIQEITEEPLICHVASIAQIKNDHFICVWYEGPYETSSDTIIKIAHKKPQTDEWEQAKDLFVFKGVPLGNPVLFSFDDERIFIIFSFLLGESWEESILCISSSIDEGKSWLNPSIFFPYKGFLAKNKPIKLSSGRIIVPIYSERELCPYIVIIDDIDQFMNSKFVAETMARGKAIQPAVVELELKKLLMFCRTNQGRIWKSMSYNDGLSWSICTPTLLPNPYSAIDLLKTSTGELLLAFNNSNSNRHSLSVSLSEDKGISWSFLKTIEKGEGEYSYPSLIQDSNKYIHLVYTVHRYQIKHVKFDLDWIKQQPLSTPLMTNDTSK